MFIDFKSLEIQWKDIKQSFPKDIQGVTLACSGGLDSTALLAIFCEIRNSKKIFSLNAFHINYGLRGAASNEDETHLKALCDALDVPLTIHQITENERQSRQGEGIQEWARRLRRQIAWTYAESGSIVAFAHHKDDVAENILMRMARGVAPTRLSGLKSWDPPFWRPLLNERKANLAAYLKHHGLTHREDASNATLDYSRNVIRHRIIPELEKLYPGATEHLAACASDADDLGKWCDIEVLREAEKHSGRECHWLSSLPRGAARLALANMIQKSAPAHRQLSRQFLDEALDFMQTVQADLSTRAWARDLPGGGRLRVEGSAVYVENQQDARGFGVVEVEALLSHKSHALISLGEASCKLDEDLSQVAARVYGTLAARP